MSDVEKKTRPVNLKRMETDIYTEMLQFRIGKSVTFKNMEGLLKDMWVTFKKSDRYKELKGG